MSSHYVVKLGQSERFPELGGKVSGLRQLKDQRFRVPITYICTYQFQNVIRSGNEKAHHRLKQAINQVIDPEQYNAVPSAANIEDGQNASFTGQCSSVLNVKGLDNVRESITKVFDSYNSSNLQSYLVNKQMDASQVKMAVLIQEMVSPVVSGVAFSKNPITGLDEMVVEAIRGSGESFVQEGVTPNRWVHKWGTWTSTPAQTDDGQAIDLDLINNVVSQTKKIAKAYGRPVDLEWVYDGNEVNWVQLREITALDIPIYSNRISKEVIPGIIKPLIWSVNIPLVNGAWVTLLTELIGPNDLDPESLAGYFYSRAYFNMGALGQAFDLLGLPRESLDLVMGVEVEGPERPRFKPSASTYRLLPRLLLFGWDKARFGRKVDAFLSNMGGQFRSFQNKPVDQLSEKQLMEAIDRLYPLAQEAAYYNIVTPVLMQIHNRILRWELARVEVDLEQFNLTEEMQELEQFEPNKHIARLHHLFSVLDKDLQARIRQSSYDELELLEGAESFYDELGHFLELFGHLSDSDNDFSYVPWRESPDLIMQVIIDYSPPEDGNPDKVQLEDLQLPYVRRTFFRSIYNRARGFRWNREAVSSLYSYG